MAEPVIAQSAASAAVPERHELYRWQLDALVSWLRCGRRGVIEAVTGSGKTDVALAAAADARRRGRFVLVVVPSRVLMEQWHRRLTVALPGARIGRLGDSGRDAPATCDVLVATRHSAAAHKPQPPEGAGGLLIADECHGLGGRILRRAMLRRYDERLGLTATLERSDDGVTDLLVPYFGGICHRYGFEQAIADGVCAQPRVALVGVDLTLEERAEYLATEDQLVSARQHLRQIQAMPLEPFGDFLAAVAHLADRDAGADGRAARNYLDAFSKRREIVARSGGKYELLGQLADAIRAADGALVFTETVRAANHAINRLDPHLSIDLITGSTARGRRKEILDDLRGGDLDAVAAPRVLDEGVDVPDASLGIVMSASRTRRQMIQRMGRVLRRKQPGVATRFLIMFAKDTVEDPTNRIDRDGFLDEIERISEAVGVFDGGSPDLDAFLAAPGPEVVPEPEHLERYADVLDGPTEPDPSTAYALLAFGTDPMGDDARLDTLSARLPQPEPDDAPYLEIELPDLPEIATPAAKPKRLSTGHVPLEIARVGDGWRIRCTGCGESSPTVAFRWQALEESVVCRCD
jgi:superfamily II DNA or RNA helicase